MIISHKTSLRKPFVFFVQLIFALFFKAFFLPFTNRRSLALPANNNYLIAANHRRAIDPFAICSAIPMGTLVRLLPFAFIVANVYYDSCLRPFLYILGGYPARNAGDRHKTFGIAASVDFLRQGYSVLIFPEGKRLPVGQRSAAYPGASKIHASCPTIPLVICHIEYQRGLRPIQITLQGQKKPPTNADEIMNAIYRM